MYAAPLAPLERSLYWTPVQLCHSNCTAAKLSHPLFVDFRIETPSMVQDRSTYVGFGAQAFNHHEDYLQLFDAVHPLKTHGLL